MFILVVELSPISSNHFVIRRTDFWGEFFIPEELLVVELLSMGFKEPDLEVFLTSVNDYPFSVYNNGTRFFLRHLGRDDEISADFFKKRN